MSNINIDEFMGDFDINIDELMGDFDNEASSTISADSSNSEINNILAILSTDSSGSETDDIKKDPTFRCKVKKSFQSTVKEGLRSGQSNARSLNLFALVSGNNQSGYVLIKSNSTSSFEVSFEDHNDIENDPIYMDLYNTGGQGNQSGYEISIEPFVDPLLPPEVIIKLLPHINQTFVAITSPYNDEIPNEGGEF